ERYGKEYKTESEKQYDKAFEKYKDKFSRSYRTCLRRGKFRVDGSCVKPKEKYQMCYVKARGVITQKERETIDDLKARIKEDKVTQWEAYLGLFTLFVLPVGFIDYAIHYNFHPEVLPKTKLDAFYEQKTDNINTSLSTCNKQDIAYRKRRKYSKKLGRLQEQLAEAEKDLSEAEKVENAEEIIKKFKPVFADMENVFELSYVKGVVVGIRKNYVVVKGWAYGVSDSKFIIYNPKKKFKLYDKITNSKSPYYYLDIDVDIGEKYPVFSPQLPRSYQPHEKNYRKYMKAKEYQYRVDRRDELVKEIKSLSESSNSN
ncbi:MAG: hypothetical protein AAF518_07800, partial [Spirochaetota bacterium]